MSSHTSFEQVMNHSTCTHERFICMGKGARMKMPGKIFFPFKHQQYAMDIELVFMFTGAACVRHRRAMHIERGSNYGLFNCRQCDARMSSAYEFGAEFPWNTTSCGFVFHIIGNYHVSSYSEWLYAVEIDSSTSYWKFQFLAVRQKTAKTMRLYAVLSLILAQVTLNHNLQ